MFYEGASKTDSVEPLPAFSLCLHAWNVSVSVWWKTMILAPASPPGMAVGPFENEPVPCRQFFPV